MTRAELEAVGSSSRVSAPSLLEEDVERDVAHACGGTSPGTREVRGGGRAGGRTAGASCRAARAPSPAAAAAASQLAVKLAAALRAAHTAAQGHRRPSACTTATAGGHVAHTRSVPQALHFNSIEHGPCPTSTAHPQACYTIIHSWLSRKFILGICILFPISVTFYVTSWFLQFFDNFFR